MKLGKIVILFIAICMLVPVVSAVDIDITGTFTPTSSTSASVNQTSGLAWGNIAPGSNSTIALKLSNTGTTTIDSTVNCSDASGDLTLVTYAELDAVDEYAVRFDLNDASWADVPVTPAVALKNDLAPSNDQDFNVRICMNSVGISASHGSQNVAITVSYEANT